jgi:hypothetical protein
MQRARRRLQSPRRRRPTRPPLRSRFHAVTPASWHGLTQFWGLIIGTISAVQYRSEGQYERRRA